MKKQFCLIIILISITLASSFIQATEIVNTTHVPSKTTLEIVNARWDSFDVFQLTARNRQVHKLICGINPFFDEKRSYLYFKNYYGIDVAAYEFEGITCEVFFKFLQATFEGVSEESPIIISLDNMDGKVIEVVLPSLNPLQDGAPEYDIQGPRHLVNF